MKTAPFKLDFEMSYLRMRYRIQIEATPDPLASWIAEGDEREPAFIIPDGVKDDDVRNMIHDVLSVSREAFEPGHAEKHVDLERVFELGEVRDTDNYLDEEYERSPFLHRGSARRADEAPEPQHPQDVPPAREGQALDREDG